MKPETGRTHEPALREVVADLDGLRLLHEEKIANAIRRMEDVEERLGEKMDERDKRYTERDESRTTAVNAALIAAKELNAASQASSKEAIIKAESAQQSYNERSNEFRGQLDDQAKRLISRLEVEQVVKNFEEKINRLDTDMRSLRESRSEIGGKFAGAQLLWGLLIGLILAGIGVAAFIRHS